jgi:hypothetical protein
MYVKLYSLLRQLSTRVFVFFIRHEGQPQERIFATPGCKDIQRQWFSPELRRDRTLFWADEVPVKGSFRANGYPSSGRFSAAGIYIASIVGIRLLTRILR